MDIRELSEVQQRQRRVEELIAMVTALQNETAIKMRELGIKPRRRMIAEAEEKDFTAAQGDRGIWE